MKYKKQIATGALAFSLLVSGSNVFAASPQDLGIKNVHQIYQKQNKNRRKLEFKKQNKIVGVVSALSGTGFTVNIKNLKTKTTSSADVKTDNGTIYRKNGINAMVSDLSPGQKIIVIGDLDKATNIISAKVVKIVTSKKNL